MTRYRLYRIEECPGCDGSGQGAMDGHPQEWILCGRCLGARTTEVRTDVVVEGPSSSSWVTFTASDGFPGLRPRDEDGYYPVEIQP